MKPVILAVMMAFATAACAKEEPKKVEPVKQEELNCVKKDKNGKCPPAPKSPKPTPKKPVEKK
jgi:hypothetical protein